MGPFPTNFSLLWRSRSLIIPDPITHPAPDALARALTRLLRPLVRLLIRSNVTFPVLAELLRTLYVEVATVDLDAGERARTDSRLSLLTGIHRKELRRQREQAGAEPEPGIVTLHSQLIGRWLGDPSYSDPDGRARPLPRTGPAPSFEALVAGVTRDVRSRAVLDEWLAQGTAELDGEGRVVLRAAAFLPQADAEARLYYFARNLHDHAAASSANMLSAPPAPFLERSVHYDKLGPQAAATIERHAREVAGSALLAVNREALAVADADDASGAKGQTRRVNFGIYIYVEDETHAP